MTVVRVCSTRFFEHEPFIISPVQPGVPGTLSSRDTSLCASARSGPSRFSDWLLTFSSMNMFRRRKSFVKRAYGSISSLIPFIRLSLLISELWLSGLAGCATTTHTARAAPPVIVAQRRHCQRYTPNGEQQGGAELESYFSDESCTLCSSGRRVSDHLC